jgi:hypothetical protein
VTDRRADSLESLDRSWGPERVAAILKHMAIQAGIAKDSGSGTVLLEVVIHRGIVRAAKCNGHEVFVDKPQSVVS